MSVAGNSVSAPGQIDWGLKAKDYMNSTNLRLIPLIEDSEIEISGDLVRFSKLTIENQQLAEYLESKKNKNEKLGAFIDLVNFAVNVKELAGSEQYSQNVKKTAEVLVQELNATVAKIDQQITSSTKAILDPETGIVAVKLKEASDLITKDKSDELKTILSPSDETSPLGLLKSAIIGPVNQSFKGLKDDLDSLKKDVNEFIGAQAKKKEMYKVSNTKGLDFESVLDQMIQIEAASHGDTAQFVGDTESASARNTGDELVTINSETTDGKSVRIVWEAKTDKTFKDAKGRIKLDKAIIELNSAMLNRDAAFGIFVADSNGIDSNVQPAWVHVDGNKLVLVLDQEDPDQRLVRLAYIWARTNVLKNLAPVEVEIDNEAINRALGDLNREIATLRNLKASHTKINTGWSEAVRFVEVFEENITNIYSNLISLIKR